MTTPRPDDVAAFYGRSYHGGRHGPTEAMALQRRRRILQQATRGVEKGVLLDIGCGDGVFLQAVNRDGWQVAGTELAPERARSAGLRVEEGIPDLADLGPIAAATLWHSLEHVEDPVGTLRELASIMRPGGVALVAVPNNAGLQAQLTHTHWLHLDVPRHLWHFTPASLISVIERAEFEPFGRWDQEFEYDVVGWSQSILSALQPSRPPVFFNWVSHRPVPAGRGVLTSNVLVGGLLSLLAVPGVPVLARMGRGSTLIVAARRLGGL